MTQKKMFLTLAKCSPGDTLDVFVISREPNGNVVGTQALLTVQTVSRGIPRPAFGPHKQTLCDRVYFDQEFFLGETKMNSVDLCSSTGFIAKLLDWEDVVTLTRCEIKSKFWHQNIYMFENNEDIQTKFAKLILEYEKSKARLQDLELKHRESRREFKKTGTPFSPEWDKLVDEHNAEDYEVRNGFDELYIRTLDPY